MGSPTGKSKWKHLILRVFKSRRQEPKVCQVKGWKKEERTFRKNRHLQVNNF